MTLGPGSLFFTLTHSEHPRHYQLLCRLQNRCWHVLVTPKWRVSREQDGEASTLVSIPGTAVPLQDLTSLAGAGTGHNG